MNASAGLVAFPDDSAMLKTRSIQMHASPKSATFHIGYTVAFPSFTWFDPFVFPELERRRLRINF
jgi:hypothetical protein